MIVEKINNKMSTLKDGLYLIGFIIELIPKIKNTLKIFEPITFPIAISFFLRLAATSDVTSSGRDVPAEIMVIPISFCDIPI